MNWRTLSLVNLAMTLLGASTFASPVPTHSPLLARSPERGWPQWRGPFRDGLCDESGLLKEWPDGGPLTLWSVDGIGNGYSCPIITGGRLFITGDFGERLEIQALDLTGKTLWRATNGLSWRGPYPGARAAVAVLDGRLFHLNAHGRVGCFDATSGRALWAVDVTKRFGGRENTWGFGECLLADDQRVFATAGGDKALMVALDARTGAVVWQSEPLLLGGTDRVASPAGEADSASYAAPALVKLAGHRQLVNCSLRHIFGVDADSGKLLWTHPLPSRYQVIASTPVLIGDAMFATAPDAGGGRLLRPRLAGDSLRAQQVWTTPLDTCHGGLVLIGDRLVGSWYRSRKGWACVDVATGKVLLEEGGLAKGAVLYADERLYCLGEDGAMALFELGSDRFIPRGRFQFVTDRVSDAWAHPVIFEKRLYLRYHGRLACFDVAGT